MTRLKSRLLPFAAALVIFVTLAFTPISASAEAHGNFYIPDGAVPVGQQFTVSVEFTASDNIGTVQAALTYNETYMEFVSGDGTSGGGGILNIRDFPSTETDTMTLDLTFTALREGSSQINLTNGSVISPDGVGLSSSITAYATITIGPSAPSDNSYADSDSSVDSDYGEYTDSAQTVTGDDEPLAQLKSLTIETGVLKPDFSPGIYDYTVNVPHDTIVFEMEGVTASLTDTIWYEGAKYLVDGKNQRTITVTDADGVTSHVYTVTIYREYGEEDSEDETQVVAEDSSETETVTSAVTTTTRRAAAPSTDSEKTGMEELRDRLMPALYVAMAVIVLAVVILIVWIKSKSKNKLK
jgi:hypothetical protein